MDVNISFKTRHWDGILIGIARNLWTQLGRTVDNVESSYPRTWTLSPGAQFFFDVIHQSFAFSHTSYTYFVRLMPKGFIFECNINGKVF
jgi:hypothetical protein